MKKRIWIITLFPEYFEPLLNCGVAGSALRGEREGQFEINTVLLRDYTPKGYKGVDSAPYGGGAGMVMRADVLKNALIEGIVKPGEYGENFKEKLHIVYTSPRGQVWNHESCRDFANYLNPASEDKDVVFICGRYEGIDERFIENYIDQQISLGDFVLTGGEPAVMIILDSALRFVSGVLGNKISAETESFQAGLIEHPQYTRPAEFEGQGVPEVLTSGHHAKIEKWQFEKQLELTEKHRPDLYENYQKNRK